MKGGKLHHRALDLTGRRFGMLTALHVEFSDGRKLRWRFQCECGGECVKTTADVNKDMKAGRTPNCGCKTRELIGRANTRHGMVNHPAYWVWRSMRDRCRLPSHQAWKNYGARGITVCARWDNSFEAFWMDMGPSYQPGLTLDRIDNSKGYSPENCRWATRMTQAGNRRKSLPVDIRKAQARTGIPCSTLNYRWKHGLSMTSSMPDPDRDSWSSVLRGHS